jgi:hypothetical protein
MVFGKLTDITEEALYLDVHAILADDTHEYRW